MRQVRADAWEMLTRLKETREERKETMWSTHPGTWENALIRWGSAVQLDADIAAIEQLIKDASQN